MRKNFKNFLKLGILLFGISILVTNCQKEDYFIEKTAPVENSNNLTIKKVSLNELKENKQLRTSLSKIEKHLDVAKQQNENSKIDATDNSFSILTDEILQATTDHSEAYTFKIETPMHPEATFENFIIEKKADQEFSISISIATKP